MSERLELEIALKGAKEVLEAMRKIDKLGDKMEAKEWKLISDKNVNDLRKYADQINRDIENAYKRLDKVGKNSVAGKNIRKEILGFRRELLAVNNLIRELTHEYQGKKIAFDIDNLEALKKLEEVEAKAQETMRKIAQIGKENALDDPRITKVRGFIDQLRSINGKVSNDQFNNLSRNAKRVTNEVKKYILEIDRRINQIGEEMGDTDIGRTLITGLQRAKNEANLLLREVKLGMDALERDPPVIKPKIEWGQIYNKWAGNFSRIGSSMITAGNTLQRITSPFENIMTGAAYGAGYGILNKVTEGFRSGFERYDIMTKYDRLMKQYEKIDKATGKVTYSTEQSKKALDESVQGLPTGLDEIVQMAQRYTLSTGDMKRGTDLAIASNNAFLASMSTQEQKYQGMLQMQDLLNGKKLQPREWMSLGASMGTAINEIAKAMGAKTQSEIEEFRQKLYAGKIEAKDFLDALVKVGTGNGKIAKMALESKNTWEAFTSRVGTAFSRMAYGVLTSIDEITKVAFDGKTLNQVLDDMLIPNIDRYTKKMKEWIKANPDKIMDFFNRLKNFDWDSAIKGFAHGAEYVLGWIDKIVSFLSRKDVGEAIGKLIEWNIKGKFLTLGGGAIKGLAPLGGIVGIVVKALRTFGSPAIGKLKNVGVFGAIIGAITKIVNPLSKLKNLGKAKDAAEELEDAGQALGKVPLTWQDVANKALGLATLPTIAGTLLLAAKAMQEISKIDMDWKKFGKTMGQMGVAFGAVAAVSTIIGRLIKSPTFAPFVGGAMVGSLVIDKIFMTIGNMGRSMWRVAKAVGEFDKITIPNTTKVWNVIKSAAEIAHAIDEADLPRYKKGTFAKTKGLAGVMENVKKMLDTSQAISTVKMGKKKIAKVKKAIAGLKPIMEDLKATILDTFGDETYIMSETKNGKQTKQERKVWNEDTVGSAVNGATGMSSIMDNVLKFTADYTLFIEQWQRLKDAISKNQTNTKDVTAHIQGTIQNMAGLAEHIKSLYTQFDGILDAPERFEAIEKVVSSIRAIMKGVTEINNEYGMGAELTIFNSLQRMITEMKGAISGAGDMIGDAMMLTVAAGMIKTAIGNIKSAVEGIDDNIAKTITVKITAKLVGDKEALSKVNNLSAQVNQARVNLTRAVTNLSGTYNAHVTINVTGTLNKNIPDIPTQDSILNPPHTGGFIDGRGRVMYRAKGGAIPIFKRKGSDTVPAMLTPGEYVQNRRAVSHFGVDFMRHINHLDLEGALRSISGRAGRLAGNTVNITNNTNNAKVVQHIHTHDTNYTFKRANRFVEAL